MNKLLFLLIIFISCFSTSCKKTTDSVVNTSNNQPIVNEVYYFLSDSNGNVQSQFTVGQDIFFNFGIINKQDTAITYSISHGGYHVVSFKIFKNNSVVGYSDDQISNPLTIVADEIQPQDTLEFTCSWYSNPYHTRILMDGEYYVTLRPFLSFTDFNLLNYLDTIYFEIKAD